MKSLLIALTFLFAASDLFAHGGGLDANGGHFDRRTGRYHKHRHTIVVRGKRSSSIDFRQIAKDRNRRLNAARSRGKEKSRPVVSGTKRAFESHTKLEGKIVAFGRSTWFAPTDHKASLKITFRSRNVKPETLLGKPITIEIVSFDPSTRCYTVRLDAGS